MPDLATLRSLLARVEAADGADRELDRGIAILFGESWDYGADWRSWGYDADGKRIEKPVAQPYTSSIDAVVALIDQVLPNSLIRLSNEYQGFWRATVRLSEGRGRPIAPLALVAALLRALIAKEEAHVEGK